MTRVAARAVRDHLGVERGRDQAPFGGRIGMRQAAAEGAAGADRVMGDVAHDRREQPAERTIHDRAVERRVAHAGADRELAVRRPRAVELRDAVDVDEMRRPRQPERHDRHEALPAGQHAAVVGRDLRQRRDRLVDRLRRVIPKGGGFIGFRLLGRERPPFHIWDYYYFLD